MTLSEAQPGIGIQPDTVIATFVARAGNVCEGYVYPMTFLQWTAITADTGAGNYSRFPGVDNSMWACVSAAANQAANEGRDGRWVLALESALDTTKFRGMVKGIAKAVVSDLANATIPTGRKLWDAPAVGSGLAGSAGGTYHLDSQALTGTGGVARNTIAQALETVTGTTSDGALMWVYFNGWDGCGFSGETQ
jgi:hypothetical protein